MRWLRSLFAWRHVFDAGVYSYYENAITGERSCRRAFSGGYSPMALDWLARRPERKPQPPRGGSGVG